MKTTKTLSINGTNGANGNGTNGKPATASNAASEAAPVQSVAAELTPEPVNVEPTPEPVKAEPTRAELIASRTTTLNRLNTIARQVNRLEDMNSGLNKFVFDVQGDEDRHFATITLVDDKRQEFRIQNAALCILMVEHLKELLASKLAEKEAELLSIQL